MPTIVPSSRPIEDAHANTREKTPSATTTTTKHTITNTYTRARCEKTARRMGVVVAGWGGIGAGMRRSGENRFVAATVTTRSVRQRVRLPHYRHASFSE